MHFGHQGQKWTVWKFQDFCIAQILQEISFGDSRSAKSAILTHLEAPNLMFYEFLKAEIYQMSKNHSPYIGKTAVLQF